MSSESTTPGSEIAPVANDDADNHPNANHPIKITSFKELASPTPGRRRETTWGKLVDAFSKPNPAPTDKHALSLCCPTVFEGDRRKAELAQEAFLFAADIDNEIKPVQFKKLKSPPPTKLVKKDGKDTYKLDPVNTVEQVLAVLSGVEAFWHTSFSNAPDWPKYRVVWLLKRPVSPAEYTKVWVRLEARFAAVGVFLDPATKNVSRAWFVPAKTEHFDLGHVRGELLDPDAILQDNTASEQKKTEGPKIEAEEKSPNLLQLVLNDYEYVRSPTGRVFGSRDGVLLPVDGDAFISKVAHVFRNASGGAVVSKDTIDKMMLAIRGGNLPTVEIPIRFGGHAGNIYVDLGDKTGRVIEITKFGAHLLEASPIAFYRPSSLRPLPTPVFPTDPEDAVAALEPFKGLLDVDQPSWAACLAFVVQAMRPSRVYSILICKGPKGIGKTTRARLLRRAIDPRRPRIDRPTEDKG